MRQPLGVSRLRRWRSRDSWTPVATVGQSSRRLVVVAVASALLCALLYAVSVLTPTGQVVADLILYGGTVTDPRIQAAAWGALGVITAGMLAGSTLGLAGLALATGRPRLAIGVIVAVGGSTATTQGLKILLARPDLVGNAAYAIGNSFPSGHVTIATALVLGGLLVIARPLRTPLAIIGTGYVAVVGMATLTAGWHRLADGIGGILVALAWTSVVAAVLVSRHGSMPRRSWRFGSGRSARRLLVPSGIAALGFGGGLVLVAWLDPSLGPGSLAATSEATRTYVGALAVIAGAALLASSALLWGLRGAVVERRD